MLYVSVPKPALRRIGPKTLSQAEVSPVRALKKTKAALRHLRADGVHNTARPVGLTE